MCRTIVITTTEQANAVMDYITSYIASAKADGYAREKAKPVRWMRCCVCGESYRGRQWVNQDCGYGLGDCCRKYGSETDTYGVAGVHYLIPEDRN